MANKTNKIQKYEAIVSYLKGETPAVDYSLDEVLNEFIPHEIELLRKKNSGERKPSKTQEENKAYATAIVEYMTENPNVLYTVTELANTIPELNGLSTSKVTAVVNGDDRIERVVDKRKSYYRLAQA